MTNKQRLGPANSGVMPAPGFGSVTHRTVVRTDGTTTRELTVELGNMEQPVRKYCADEVGLVFREPDEVLFVFSQLGVSGTFRNTLVVKMFSDSIHRLVKINSNVKETMWEGENASLVRAIPTRIPGAKEEPATSVALSASVAQISYSGHEAEINFHHLSPYHVARAIEQQSTMIQIEPVVQVSLSIGRLKTVLLELAEIQKRLPPDPAP